MAPPALLARLVLLITLLLGVAAVEHGAPESKTPKRQSDYPRVYVEDYNLFVNYSSTDKRQLSTTGTEQNPFSQGNIFISPNKTYVAAWQYTPDEGRRLRLIESRPSDQVQPKLFKDEPYLKPGDRVRIDRPRLFHLTSRLEIPTSDTLFTNPYRISHVGWSDDGSEYRFVFNERGHQHLRVIGMNINSTVRAIVDESSTTFIDYAHKTYLNILEQTQELLWFSERDGWNHLYLYDLPTGTVKNQMTTGNWLVRGIERVDPNTRKIWFQAYGIVPGQDPYYAHLARVNFDGTNLVVLTSGHGDEGNGTHTWSINESNNTFIDNYSRVDQPERSLLRDYTTGQVLALIHGPTLDIPASQVAQIFVAPGRDGVTPIYGLIVKPRDFDPSKKYPIIEDIYAGPHDYSTPKAWSDLGVFRPWADLGYIVVKIDGMGTNWRHKAFHDVAHKNLGDAGFPDRIAWIQAAAASRPWMDTTRVGILGGSAGGQNAMGALLFHGDFYKAAMADSGCHDNRMDKIWWNEAWMGWPVGPQYSASSNVDNAHKLQGKLLLLVGELDDNVDPASTYQVVHALNAAGKDYEFVMLPGMGHSSGFGEYGRMRGEKFFKKHLQDV